MVRHADALQAAEIIKSFGDEEPKSNSETGVVTMSVSGGASKLIHVVRKIDEAELKLSDIMLRRPSLDDVFMKLTGHTTEEIINLK